MNNDLEQFSEERLKQMVKFCETSIHGLPKHFEASEVAALARIALSAKQAKPVGYISERNLNALGKQFSVCVKHEPVMVRPIPIYTTTQPAHTEHSEMLNKAHSLSKSIGELRKLIDSSGGYDFEALRSEQVNSPAIPDGWKLVPIEPTEKMKAAAEGEYSLRLAYKAMLRAAPKPESE